MFFTRHINEASFRGCSWALAVHDREYDCQRSKDMAKSHLLCVLSCVLEVTIHQISTVYIYRKRSNGDQNFGGQQRGGRRWKKICSRDRIEDGGTGKEEREAS